MILEIFSELFSFQKRAKVTMSAICQNGCQIVSDNPSEISIASSNNSSVSVVNHFMVAESSGLAQPTVMWIVCEVILVSLQSLSNQGKDLTSIIYGRGYHEDH